MSLIPFNKPYMTGKELWNIAQAHAKGHLAGDGSFTKLCNQWIEQRTGSNKALLTHSCTAGLEMAALLAEVGPGDEVIMPSYTFVSTANAFVLRGAVPVFVDIRPDTLNLDEKHIEAAITDKTRAIVPVHYAGVGCEMDTIMAIAAKHKLVVIEDAAQALMSSYKGRPLGAIGDLGAISFHETKNIISGEGGAILVNNDRYAERAGKLRRPIVPAHCTHNAHMYYILLPDLATRTAVIAKLKAAEVNTVFHYIPLHSAPAGRKFARTHGEMMVTDDIADRLLRLPMYAGLEERQAEAIRIVLSVL